MNIKANTVETCWNTSFYGLTLGKLNCLYNIYVEKCQSSIKYRRRKKCEKEMEKRRNQALAVYINKVLYLNIWL